MQKSFLHEKLTKPRLEEFRILRAMCEIYSTTLREQVSLLAHDEAVYLPLDRQMVDRVLTKWRVHRPFEQIEPAIRLYMSDPATTTLAGIMELFDKKKANGYVFTKEFWPVLRKTAMNNVSWGVLPDDFQATIRWPTPLLDKEGDEFDEMLVMIKPREAVEAIRHNPFKKRPGEGHNVLMCWWSFKGGQSGFFTEMIPDANDKIVPDLWQTGTQYYADFLGNVFKKDNSGGDEPYITDLVKALVYIASGDPDLRGERNPLRYKDKNKKEPVEAHRRYSEIEYQLVGWNWKKMMERRASAFSKDSWPVEPFPRYQPYGPRDNPKYKWIIVEGHERFRDPSKIKPEAASEASPS